MPVSSTGMTARRRAPSLRGRQAAAIQRLGTARETGSLRCARDDAIAPRHRHHRACLSPDPDPGNPVVYPSAVVRSVWITGLNPVMTARQARKKKEAARRRPPSQALSLDPIKTGSANQGRYRTSPQRLDRTESSYLPHSVLQREDQPRCIRSEGRCLSRHWQNSD